MAGTLDLGSGSSSFASAILDIPSEKIPEVCQHLLKRALKQDTPPPQDALRLGILTEQGELTPLGECMADLLLHEHWVEGDEIKQTLSQYPEHPRRRVLDVGCSTGRTLRQLSEFQWRAGIDVDASALALGHRLAESEDQDLELRCASAHKLPFEAAMFDVVICRNAITYTHQSTALAELVRVLHPGGLLLLRYENFRYDIQQLLKPPSLKAFVCRARDCAFGVIHAAVGAQLQPKSNILPARIFGSTIQFRKSLRRKHCELLQVTDGLKCPKLWGRANQTTLLARKLGLSRVSSGAVPSGNRSPSAPQAVGAFPVQ